ncbi:MAG: archaellin/type IV pilin N-terminal domain-containing protein [Nitrososphaera sp.]
MSNKTFNARNNKAKKGISPVIATVILVAVAVVIAAALAGFSSSLFGTYAGSGSAVTVGVTEVHTDGSGSFVLKNSGTVQDTLVSIQVVGQNAFQVVNGAIPANGGTLTVPAAQGDLGTFTAADEGKPVTVKFNMASGSILTISTTLLA